MATVGERLVQQLLVESSKARDAAMEAAEDVLQKAPQEAVTEVLTAGLLSRLPPELHQLVFNEVALRLAGDTAPSTISEPPLTYGELQDALRASQQREQEAESELRTIEAVLRNADMAHSMPIEWDTKPRPARRVEELVHRLSSLRQELVQDAQRAVQGKPTLVDMTVLRVIRRVAFHIDRTLWQRDMVDELPEGARTWWRNEG